MSVARPTWPGADVHGRRLFSPLGLCAAMSAAQAAVGPFVVIGTSARKAYDLEDCMTTIGYLADHLAAIPTLVQWFREQWPDYFAKRSDEEIANDFKTEANFGGLPVRLVAFAEGELAGTITLRELAFDELSEYSPGLGGLFVLERHRRKGIGSELVKAGTKLAQRQGYQRVYVATLAARGIMERQGWRLIKEVNHGDEAFLLFCCEL